LPHCPPSQHTFGEPHITGETEAAVAFGFGYAQAEDHAAEMARRFLAARGEAAKYLGARPSGRAVDRTD
jgi:acyl-homoserine-lactone acylase